MHSRQFDSQNVRFIPKRFHKLSQIMGFTGSCQTVQPHPNGFSGLEVSKIQATKLH